MPRVVREHEILRISATIPGLDAKDKAKVARRELVAWAQRRCGGKLPKVAWDGLPFEYFSGGRNAIGVRIGDDPFEFWALRSDDPDKSVAGRIWTSEAVLVHVGGDPVRFCARLLASTPEEYLVIDPHVQGFVQQLVEKCGLLDGPYSLCVAPRLIRSEEETAALIDMLVDSKRRLPVFVLTVPVNSVDIYRPVLNVKTLAKAVLGLAHVFVLPSAFTWRLTEHFGKVRSVFGGASRAYLSGFTEDADPYNHRLFLADQAASAEGAIQCLRWMRSLAASESIRRTKLGESVLAFGSVREVSLRLQQEKLKTEGASDAKQLEAAQRRIEALEKRLSDESAAQEYFASEHDLAIQRAEAAEEQGRRTSHRVQQLLALLEQRGQAVDDSTQLPEAWSQFVDWCDTKLSGQVVLTPRARSSVRSPAFTDVLLAARCLIWLGGPAREMRICGGGGEFNELVVEEGVRNSHCGADEFDFDWQGKRLTADWHIKNGGNTRDRARCLRIYYAWDPETQQMIVADMPAHRRTGAS
jgi:hypothetical protein